MTRMITAHHVCASGTHHPPDDHSSQVRFVVMANVFAAAVPRPLGEPMMDERYDLKGSWVNRNSSRPKVRAAWRVTRSYQAAHTSFGPVATTPFSLARDPN